MSRFELKINPDAGEARLPGLAKPQFPQLSNTAISDAGLETLSGMKTLKQLTLMDNANFTDHRTSFLSPLDLCLGCSGFGLRRVGYHAFPDLLHVDLFLHRIPRVAWQMATISCLEKTKKPKSLIMEVNHEN